MLTLELRKRHLHSGDERPNQDRGHQHYTNRRQSARDQAPKENGDNGTDEQTRKHLSLSRFVGRFEPKLHATQTSDSASED